MVQIMNNFFAFGPFSPGTPVYLTSGEVPKPPCSDHIIGLVDGHGVHLVKAVVIGGEGRKIGTQGSGQMQRVVGEQAVLPLEIKSQGHVGSIQREDGQIACQKILNIEPVLADLSQEGWVLAQRPGRVGTYKSQALGLLHHPAVAELCHRDRSDEATNFTGCATDQEPLALN
jgi:hypothetical protein